MAFYKFIVEVEPLKIFRQMAKMFRVLLHYTQQQIRAIIQAVAGI
jgi:hypothetical protein